MSVDKIEDDIRLFKADFKQHPHVFNFQVGAGENPVYI